MLRPLGLSLLILIAVSCSVSPNANGPGQIRSSTAVPTLAPTVSITPTAPSENSTSPATVVSPDAGSTRIIVLQATSPAFLAGAVPTIARATTPLARTGWQTYVDVNLHLALDYPPDWTVRVQDGAIVFTSPQGITIQLAPIDPRALAPSDEMIQPNTRCSETVNPHGIPVHSCLATIGFSLDAYLDLKSANGAETAAAISTGSRGASGVFDALIESARLAP